MSSLTASASNPPAAPAIAIEGKQVLELLDWAHQKYPQGFDYAGEFVQLGRSGNFQDKIWMEIWPVGTSPHQPHDPGRWVFRSRFTFDYNGALGNSHEGGTVPSTRDLNPFFAHLIELRGCEAHDLGAAGF